MNKSIVKFNLSLVFALGLVGGFANISLAQLEPSQGGGEYQKNEQSATQSSSFGNGFNPLDLIHNANFRRSRGAQEFVEDTQNGITNEAEKFKRLQQQRLQQQNSNSQPESVN